MEVLKLLIARFRRLRFPVVIGFFLILNVGVGLVYLQQQRVQMGLNNQISLSEQRLRVPVQASGKLQADYQAAQQALPTGLKGDNVIRAVVAIAQESGFDVSPEAKVISIEQRLTKPAQVEKKAYQVLLFSVGAAAKDYKQVMSFLSRLYSAPGLETLVLEDISISYTKAGAKAEAGAKADIDFGVYTRTEPGAGGK